MGMIGLYNLYIYIYIYIYMNVVRVAPGIPLRPLILSGRGPWVLLVGRPFAEEFVF